ncbi:MAG: hypothetical protein F6J93_01655 [Oscillatoria sp. SIO1A7]|nr:hypothetical protein [Oscillatoria sp. SIO1A7]
MLRANFGPIYSAIATIPPNALVFTPELWSGKHRLLWRRSSKEYSQ